jgi:hypothetical protein
MLHPVQPARAALGPKGFLFSITIGVRNMEGMAVKDLICQFAVRSKSNKDGAVPSSMRDIMAAYAPSGRAFKGLRKNVFNS